MGKVEIQIDGRAVTAEEGDRVLWAALDAGIYVPHLCAGREIAYHPGSCRLCFVEVEGREAPVTACTEMVRPGMAVKTRSPRVDRLVRSGFALIMSTHRLDCAVCPANKKCALQKIARERKLPLKPRGLPKIEPNWPIDDSRPEFGLNPNHCILCGQCVHVCNEITRSRVLDFRDRGMMTRVGTFDGLPLSEHECKGCGECVKVCPVGALYLKSSK
jgi:bidirectional [NiFe] hydrogenase diaphorase subunit